MKLIIEIPDSASSPKEAATEATVTPAPAKAENLAPPKQNASDKTSVPRATKEAESAKSEEKPSQQPAASSSGNFAHQGGISNVSDPDRGKRGFQYSYQEEKL